MMWNKVSEELFGLVTMTEPSLFLNAEIEQELTYRLVIELLA